jgi:voltage-dependent calcium channel L type alpha-1D
VWWFVTSQPFEYGLFVMIMLNVITLALKIEGGVQDLVEYDKVLDYMNYFFTAVFTVELGLKLYAFHFKNYVADPW